jgi:hypothetical protein
MEQPIAHLPSSAKLIRLPVAAADIFKSMFGIGVGKYCPAENLIHATFSLLTNKPRKRPIACATSSIDRHVFVVVVAGKQLKNCVLNLNSLRAG